MATALITGGARRIGRFLTLYLIKNGWNIIVHYNQSHSDASSINSSLSEEEKGRIELARLDFSAASCNFPALFHATKEPISLLINNASAFKNDFIYSLNSDEVSSCLATNLTAPIILTSLFARQNFPKNANLNIINMLDCNAYSSANNFCTYRLTKLALTDFTKTSARQLAPKIRVNGIAVGYALKSEQQNQENFENEIKKSILGRQVQCEEIANTLDFIIKTHSMTGQIICLGT